MVVVALCIFFGGKLNFSVFTYTSNNTFCAAKLRVLLGQIDVVVRNMFTSRVFDIRKVWNEQEFRTPETAFSLLRSRT